jgi:hypothetical protein
MSVQESRGSPLVMSFHSSHRPAIESTPAARHETPTHGHEFACPFAHTDCINGSWSVRRCSVAARRLGQPIELDEFAPRCLAD